MSPMAGALAAAFGLLVLGSTPPRRPATRAHRWRDWRFSARARPDLAGLAGQLARSLRSGLSIPASLEEAAAGADRATVAVLEPLLRDLRSGRSLPSAIDAWADRSDRDVGLLGAVLLAGHELGGVTARVLDETADALSARADARAEIRTQSTTARLSAQVVALAPLAGLGLAAIVDRGSIAFLVTSPAGRGCLVAGLALDATGAWWMSRMQRSAMASW